MKSLKQQFDDNGYVVLDWVYSFEAINSILSDLDGKYRYDSEFYNLNNRIEGAYRISEGVNELACDLRILETLQFLLGGKFFPFQTLNFERGTEQNLHSDWYHFAPLTNHGLAGVWVAFEDIDSQNGALSVVPGSHRFPYLFPEDLGLKAGSRKNPYEYYRDYEDAIQKKVVESGLEIKAVPMKKGQVLIWHANLIHGGSKITDTQRTRYSQVTHYFIKNSVYFSPISSKRAFLNRSFRWPINILTGKRIFGF